MNAEIKTALSSFGDPVEAGEVVFPPGEAPSRYYSFNYSILGADFSDDAPNYQRYLVQVHFFCPRTFDSVQRIAQTQRALFSAGFTWPDVIFASDEDGQHIVFECEGVEVVDTG